jgi:choline dehydrogenase-like flavoprotein
LGRIFVAVFDYVIVGAGSAGAVLANRLSADPAITVCLIEAGGHGRSPLVTTPLGVMALPRLPTFNWGYTSAPQRALNNREIGIPRGKSLGGSSAINGMVYIRGHRDDYDDWANAGCTGWGYDDVLAYFKKSEANGDPQLDDALHGREGPLSVVQQRSPNAMDSAFIEAANQLQIRSCPDFNTAEPEGVGIYQVTQKDGRRHSTGAAFLQGISKRPNLLVETHATVEHFSNGKVTLRRSDRSTSIIEARGEIILSAGAIGSPDLLLRSGIGPGAALQQQGSPSMHDLPGVGENLHDHVDVMVISKSTSITPYGVSFRALPKLTGAALMWLFARRGMLSSNMVEAGGFVRSQASEERPDLQFHLIPGRKSLRGRLVEYGHGVSLHTCVLQPKSRGTITRTSPDGPPQIDLGLLTHEDDMTRLIHGVKLARQILAQTPMAKYGLTELLPGADTQSDESIADFIKAEARTVYHPVGTCAMGVGPNAVVDPRLRVHGMPRLRVVDASIMPKIVSGNTNAPAIMIAEKAADMILEDRSVA